MDKKKKNDILMIVIILIIAAGFMFYKNLSAAKGEQTIIVVKVNDQEVFREDAAKLKLPYSFEVEGYNGGTNQFCIDQAEDGAIRLCCMEADCPDKICVETGVVSMPDQPIVCLPHRVTGHIIKME